MTEHEIDAALKETWDRYRIRPTHMVATVPVTPAVYAAIAAASAAVDVTQQDGFFDLDRRLQKRLVNKATRAARSAILQP